MGWPSASFPGGAIVIVHFLVKVAAEFIAALVVACIAWRRRPASGRKKRS